MENIEIADNTIKIDLGVCPFTITADIRPVRLEFKSINGEIHIETGFWNYKSVALRVAELIYQEGGDSKIALEKLADESYKQWSNKGGIGEGDGLDRSSEKIEMKNVFRISGSDIYMTLKAQQQYDVQFALAIMEKCGHKPGDLKIYVNASRKELEKGLKDRILVREVLGELANEGSVIYEPHSMPKGNEAIKFLTKEIDSYWNEEKGECPWDWEISEKNSFLEYFVNEEKLKLTVYIRRKNYNSLANKRLYEIAKLSFNRQKEYFHFSPISVPLPKSYFREDKETFKSALKQAIETINNTNPKELARDPSDGADSPRD